MKKIIALLFTALLVFTLAACGTGNSNNADSSGEGNNSNKSDKETTKLVIGATNEPHAVILEEAKPLLEEKGIELDVKVFSKYELINPALVDGDLDANFFQHIPYLE